jgi:hypothetical protein
MEAFHAQIADLQKKEGVRVINRAHMLGFLDSSLPRRGEQQIKPQAAEATSSG